jgi:hypothetical protein
VSGSEELQAFEAWLEQLRIELDEDGVTADPAAIKKLTGMLAETFADFRLQTGYINQRVRPTEQSRRP